MLQGFHPAVSHWFTQTFDEPTKAQQQAWPAIKQGQHILLAAPTGSGKTLAAFLASIDDLVHSAQNESLEDEVQVIYISPLKALSNDIQRNLQQPLEGINESLEELGYDPSHIRTALRTGDTDQKTRAAILRRPPHLFVTTPESLYILLTSKGGRGLLKSAKTVIVDEIHALVENKRGSHLALSLERLDALCGHKLRRIGLSATQRPIKKVAHFLVGTNQLDDCRIIDLGHQRKTDLRIEVPPSPLEAVMAAEVWEETYNRLTQLILSHKTTLIFVNTRRMAERLSHNLRSSVGEDQVMAHHGSMARKQRFKAEQRLKAGDLSALVATASLELGIDIGDVDLVCQIGNTRSIASFLQRVGRSGHQVNGTPKGRLFPLSRDELVQGAAMLNALRQGELDKLVIPELPLDILAQQIVAEVAADEWDENALFETYRQAYPYRNLVRKDYDDIVQMLSEGFSTRKGRRSAYLHHDAIGQRLRPRRSARLAAITSGGAIADTASYDVILHDTELKVGTVHEDFAVESLPGDIFQLGTTSWQVTKVEQGKIRVQNAGGQPPTIPFWLGESPARTAELSAAVAGFRQAIEKLIDQPEGKSWQQVLGEVPSSSPYDSVPDPQPKEQNIVSHSAQKFMVEALGLSDSAAEQILHYLAESKRALGSLPTQDTLIIERFFDESGGMQLIVHSPFGARLNRAWGLALRKRFCRSFNFELQAAATEEAILLSLGQTHSFPLDEVFQFLNHRTVRTVLIQALLDAPMFETRWRWNCARALAVLRFRVGKKIPPQMQRFMADDLISVVFPDQLACLENIAGGHREIPDHPLVSQTIKDCLEEAMDIDRLEALLADMESGKKTLIARDLSEPSPMAAEIIHARPYAFLDDAPLEERRAQAVYTRRAMQVSSASALGALDPDAIAQVRGECWPLIRDADELHDALHTLGFLSQFEGMGRGHFEGTPPFEKSNFAKNHAFQNNLIEQWPQFFNELRQQGRATEVHVPGAAQSLWVAAERLSDMLSLHPKSKQSPELSLPDRLAKRTVEAEDALLELVRSRLEGMGPCIPETLARLLTVPLESIEQALYRLEAEGFVFRGRYSPGVAQEEWCERRLLARIHRYTIGRLRKAISPVSPADYMRFLLEWQRLHEDDNGSGPEGLAHVLTQLEGFEANASAWEEHILPRRVKKYDPKWLDQLCLAGRFTWAKPAGATTGVSPIRSTPIALLQRQNLQIWNVGAGPDFDPKCLGSSARRVYQLLQGRGAQFAPEMPRLARLLPEKVKEALAELVAQGLVTSDSYSGLRTLVLPSKSKAKNRGRGNSRRNMRSLSGTIGLEGAGRWSLLQQPAPLDWEEDDLSDQAEQDLESKAYVLLQRYGVLFRKVLERERRPPQWRPLLMVLRRLEARGEIRGGRFVNGFSGEQFALPESVVKLRGMRDKEKTGQLVAICASDPLNMTGIINSGRRIPATGANHLLLRDGVPIAAQEGKKVSFLQDVEPEEKADLERALIARSLPIRLRVWY